MTTNHFEDILENMTKPEIRELKHEAALSKIIMKAKNRSVVSFWWLCIPLYIIVALIMKTYFTPNVSLTSTLHEFTKSRSHAAILLFLVLPLLLIVINLLSIKQLFFLYNTLVKEEFLKKIATQILIILFSLFVLFIYFL